MHYSVAHRIGRNAITSEDGERTFRFIRDILQQDGFVVLDFTTVKIATASFLGAAIGQLLRDFQPFYLNEHLVIKNLPVASREILEQVIANAKDYYSVAGDTEAHESEGI